MIPDIGVLGRAAGGVGDLATDLGQQGQDISSSVLSDLAGRLGPELGGILSGIGSQNGIGQGGAPGRQQIGELVSAILQALSRSSEGQPAQGKGGSEGAAAPGNAGAAGAGGEQQSLDEVLSILAQVLKENGYDPKDIAKAFADAGVPAEAIAKSLADGGFSPDEVSAALSQGGETAETVPGTRAS